MQIIPLYIKIEQKNVVTNTTVLIKDIAKIYCTNSSISKKVGDMTLTTITGKENQKIMFSIMLIPLWLCGWLCCFIIILC